MTFYRIDLIYRHRDNYELYWFITLCCFTFIFFLYWFWDTKLNKIITLMSEFDCMTKIKIILRSVHIKSIRKADTFLSGIFGIFFLNLYKNIRSKYFFNSDYTLFLFRANFLITRCTSKPITSKLLKWLIFCPRFFTTIVILSRFYGLIC